MDEATMDGVRLRLTGLVTKNAIANPGWTVGDHFAALQREGFSEYQVRALASRQVHAAVLQNEQNQAKADDRTT